MLNTTNLRQSLPEEILRYCQKSVPVSGPTGVMSVVQQNVQVVQQLTDFCNRQQELLGHIGDRIGYDELDGPAASDQPLTNAFLDLRRAMDGRQIARKPAATLRRIFQRCHRQIAKASVDGMFEQLETLAIQGVVGRLIPLGDDFVQLHYAATSRSQQQADLFAAVQSGWLDDEFRSGEDLDDDEVTPNELLYSFQVQRKVPLDSLLGGRFQPREVADLYRVAPGPLRRHLYLLTGTYFEPGTLEQCSQAHCVTFDRYVLLFGSEERYAPSFLGLRWLSKWRVPVVLAIIGLTLAYIHSRSPNRSTTNTTSSDAFVVPSSVDPSMSPARADDDVETLARGDDQLRRLQRQLWDDMQQHVPKYDD